MPDSTDPIADVSSLDVALAYRVHRLARLLRVHLTRVLADAAPGVSPEQWFLLFRLSERDGRSQSDLTDPVLDDRPNVSRQVAGLVEAGLIARAPDPDDGRRSLLSLTAAGRAQVDTLLGTVVEERGKLFAGVTADALGTFSEVLDVLTGAVSGARAQD